MKYLVYLFSAVNLYAGIRFLLNSVGILQTSKYGNSSNIFFAITLTTAALFALYFSVLKGNHSYAFLIDAAPWTLTLILLVGNMIFGDYR